MKKALIGVFFAVIVLLSSLTLILPKRDFSEMENRPLAQAPKLSVDHIMDQSFMKDTEKFLADQTVFRDEFVAARTRLEMAAGKREINGVFIGDTMLMGNTPKPDSQVTQGNCAAINAFAENHAGHVETTVMLIPTAAAFYPNEAPALAELTDQATYIQNFYKALKGVGTVDTYTPLAAASSEYIFYRTDHHWTSYGAYVGYNALSKNLGYKAVSRDMFNIEHVSHNFLGTLYSKVLYGEQWEDGIDLYSYVPGDTVTDVVKCAGDTTATYSSLFFRDSLEEKNQYEVFLGRNTGVVHIHTNVNNGKKLLVFKDSFANSMMQFLSLHYEEITLVDLRYLTKPLEEYLYVEDYQQALFLYNVGNFTDDASLTKVARY